MHPGSEAEYSQLEVDLQMDCVAFLDATTAGPVSPNGYYVYGWYVGWPLTCYRLERVSAHADVVGPTSLGAIPICGDS